MLRVILFRAILIAAPFVIWFVWAEYARRTGRPMGATPWAWLSAAAGVLFGLSLLAGAFFQGDDTPGRYVPAETLEDGRIAPGRMETAPGAQRP